MNDTDRIISPLKEHFVEMTMGVLINKLNRDTFNSLVRQIKRFLKKYTDKSQFSSLDFLEVNSFLFVTCNIPLLAVQSPNQRKELINQLEQIIHKYCDNECKNYSKEIRKNVEIKDITKILTNLVRSSGSSESQTIINDITAKADEIDDRVIDRVNSVVQQTFLIIWDFPDDYPDIIMFPDMILKRDLEDKKSNIPLRSIAEHLLIAQFGKACATNLVPLLTSNEDAIEVLGKLILDKDNVKLLEEQMTNKLWRTLRVVFGLLSSTQQAILVLQKQLKRIKDVTMELRSEVELLTYDPLMDYLMMLESMTNCEELYSRLSNLQVNVKQIFQVLLSIINKYKDLPEKEIDQIDYLSDIFTKTLTEIQLLKYYADKFRDLAYFQSIPTDGDIDKKQAIEVDKDIILKGVSLFKTYRLIGSTVYALRGVDIEIKKGEMAAIIGPSGSGKTTLLNLLSGLDTPNRGAVFLRGINIDTMADSELSMFRRKNIGFIFQYYNLVPQLTVLENVMLPGLMIGRPKKEVKKRALELIKEVDIERFQNQYPIKLSGGQMQRVTIARAMINNPAVLFADEPTGDLDSQTGEVVIDLIKSFAKEQGTAVILVTHDKKVAQACDRIIEIGDGKIVAT